MEYKVKSGLCLSCRKLLEANKIDKSLALGNKKRFLYFHKGKCNGQVLATFQA